MGEGTFRIPGAAWRHRFDEPLDNVRGQASPGPLQILKMLPMIGRLMRYSRERQESGFDPINMQSGGRADPYQGVPLGGIGAGSIGRGWRGDFRRWQLRPGTIISAPVMADQFSLFVQREGRPGEAQVLFPGQPEDGSLSAWRWNLPAETARYNALFPRAWTEYEDPLPGVRLTCRQLSPVIAHNYRESSLPVCEFRWQIENTSAQPIKAALMFTFQNGMGAANDAAGGHENLPFTQDGARGVLLRHHYRQAQTVPLEERKTRLDEARVQYEDALAFAIAATGGEVSWHARFDPAGDGAEVWRMFSAEGRLEGGEDTTPSAEGQKIAAALAVTVELAPGETREVAFGLAWDMPIARFGYGSAYRRRYTAFYDGAEDSAAGKIAAGTPAAARLAADALTRADEWERAVEEWQSPILLDTRLPLWYRQALFNELYYLVDGGTLWASAIEGQDPDAEMGRFAYLEGHEYRMYNTYDVHFYASFALAMNWPRLELALQRDIAAATLAHRPETKSELYSGRLVPRKIGGAVPHDIGWPDEDPWKTLNGYFLHDVNDWKDLNSKFVLQVFRDFTLTRSAEFARDMWAAVEAALRHLNRFDRDGDGLIENDGIPDQTYDMWRVKGISAYTAGLWLAALQAGACLADIAGETTLALEYRRIFERGKKAYQEKLWNGRYFNYDSSRSRQHDSIMAGQLAGQWYARACGLEPIVEPLMARAALMTIYDWNVQRFAGGTLGAVNGMRPNGTVDRTSMQSQEVWTGTTYALAAAMIQEGLPDEAFTTAWGVYKTTYEETGYWFQTPEAWNEHGEYRAIAYMRPLAIWAMQWALEKDR
jgi:non-lysosomal glucosylceramidase